MKCDNCNCSETYVKQFAHTYTIKGKIIEFVSNRRFCKKCNSLIFDEELDNLASERAICIYNEKYGIDKQNIIDLRKSFNLSQLLFAKIIGCAKKTLISYEKGKSVPNDCYLTIIKSLLSKPDTIFTYIEVNKEQFTEKEYQRLNNRISSEIIDEIGTHGTEPILN